MPPVDARSLRPSTQRKPVVEYHFRPACEADTPAAVPLIYSSGPEAFEYAFSSEQHSARSFLEFAFGDGQGLFGWRNHAVVVADGELAAIGSFYSGRDYARLSRTMGLQILRFFPAAEIPGVLWRALKLKALLPPPSLHMQYVANLGVKPELRSHGLGAALLAEQERLARVAAYRCLALDVAITNPRAQALYQRLGFQVTGEQRFSGPIGRVPHTRRMEKPLELPPI